MISQHLHKLLPQQFTNYYEPFVGGGAMLFYLHNKGSHCHINDINKNLINTYLALQNNVNKVIQNLTLIQKFYSNINNLIDQFEKQNIINVNVTSLKLDVFSKFYNALVDVYNGIFIANGNKITIHSIRDINFVESIFNPNESKNSFIDNIDIEFLEKVKLQFFEIFSNVKKNNSWQATLFISLNKLGFNGMYRVSGNPSKKEFVKFNIPFGQKIALGENTLFDENNLKNISAFLKNNVKITSHSYSSVIREAQKGDFIFCDPPYDYEKNVEYTATRLYELNLENYRFLRVVLKNNNEIINNWNFIDLNNDLAYESSFVLVNKNKIKVEIKVEETLDLNNFNIEIYKNQSKENIVYKDTLISFNNNKGLSFDIKKKRKNNYLILKIDNKLFNFLNIGSKKLFIVLKNSVDDKQISNLTIYDDSHNLEPIVKTKSLWKVNKNNKTIDIFLDFKNDINYDTNSWNVELQSSNDLENWNYIDIKFTKELKEDDGGFNSYDHKTFNSNDQKQLANLLIKAHKRGVLFMITNHNTRLINELYNHKDFYKYAIDTNRAINSDGNQRKNTGKEIVITNYKSQIN